MSIRLQDITTSTNVTSSNKVLVTDGSTEYLATLETVFNAIKSFLPIETFSVSSNGTKDILIGENTAGVVFTSGAGGTKSIVIFNATSGGNISFKQMTDETNLNIVASSASNGVLTFTSTGSVVGKCMVLYWNGTVTV